MGSNLFEFKTGTLTVTVRDNKLYFFEKYFKEIKKNESIYITPVSIIRPVITDRPNNKHLIVDIIYSLSSTDIKGEWNFITFSSAIMVSSINPIDKNNDLWLIIHHAHTLIKEYIESNELEINNSPITMPAFVLAPQSFENIVFE